MKRLSCPRCGHYLTFNENEYPSDRVLVFVCPACQKQFKIKLGSRADKPQPALGKLIVLENTFHERQELPLTMGDNVIGRYVKGTAANRPIMTSDPSIEKESCNLCLETPQASPAPSTKATYSKTKTASSLTTKPSSILVAQR